MIRKLIMMVEVASQSEDGVDEIDMITAIRDASVVLRDASKQRKPGSGLVIMYNAPVGGDNSNTHARILISSVDELVGLVEQIETLRMASVATTASEDEMVRTIIEQSKEHGTIQITAVPEDESEGEGEKEDEE